MNKKTEITETRYKVQVINFTSEIPLYNRITNTPSRSVARQGKDDLDRWIIDNGFSNRLDSRIESFEFVVK